MRERLLIHTTNGSDMIHPTDHTRAHIHTHICACTHTYTETHTHTHTHKDMFWNNLKSSMESEKVREGRPYGGFGFICRGRNNLVFTSIQVDNDRINGLQIKYKDTNIITIIGVYLPYYDDKADQIQLYIETLDILQGCIDSCDMWPVMVVGDMNSALPRAALLPTNWYRKHPFTTHSLLLYDFLVQNDLYFGNHCSKQKVQYRYFIGQHTSYIDYVLVSNHFSDQITSCNILSDIVDNVSDHLPLRTCISLQLKQPFATDISRGADIEKYPLMDWSDKALCARYSDIMSQSSLCFRPIPTSSVTTVDQARNAMNAMNKQLNTLFHDTVQTICDDNLPKYKGTYKRNTWWTKDCYIARDRHRFRYRIWKSCDRPRQGRIYDCYKLAN